jgi:hypothetical protein
MCDPETSRTRRPWFALGFSTTGKRQSKCIELMCCGSILQRSVIEDEH